MATKTTTKKSPSTKRATKSKATIGSGKGKSSQRGLSWFYSRYTVAVFAIFAGLLGTLFVVASQAATFELVGAIPGASSQPSGGKPVKALRVFNGKVYAGYGDWNANTGPIQMQPFNTATNTFAATSEYAADTEAIEIFREIGGKLYAPSTDPKSSADYSVGTKNADGTTGWTMNNSMRMVHVFDIAQGATANELYLAGSKHLGRGKDDAVVYRSLDGGATWSLILQYYSDPTKHARFMTIANHGGKIYTHGYEFADGGYATALPTWKVWNGSGWSNGASSAHAKPYHADSYAGKFIYQSSTHGGSLYTMTTEAKATSTLLLSSIRNFTIADDGYLYALKIGGEIVRTKDLTAWQTIGYGPSNAAGFDVEKNTIYIGTYEAQLYRATIDSLVSDTVAPANTMTAPTQGATITGNLLVSGNATDANGIQRVDIYIDNSRVQYLDKSFTPYANFGVEVPDHNGLMTSGYPTTSWLDGTHTVKTIAYDYSGNATTSSVTVTFKNGTESLDKQAPSITSFSPVDGTKLKGRTLTIKMSASDGGTNATGIGRTAILLDNLELYTTTSSSLTYKVPVANIATGEHKLTFKAVDKAGNETLKEITIIR